ncbi:hypothetical protein L0Z42_29475 [Burkholderia multivorans]|uniref:hypothetical protein n=1 Tax=Burkholderia cepacia complex TaxID=87882 RepID=UPI0005BC5403|nr:MULTISPECIES: hypothetical protein [Burkholderia cepacia complex]MBJ9624983.1 hypothetical protein [Burkholderia multivorans]MCO1374622.1 hypothetical protein [Burkholderia multivorans]MCO1459766.1 hypothetical protein [Burkholderia multivorans]PRE22520.1 hypothetical protein C6P79_25350 [Burkholderia multivorans]PRF47182.1 hypothetical protein C6Q04_18815 [Burkholderia multivorans]
MSGDLHKLLVTLGERWLKRQGFAVVATELVTLGTREQADVIGFKSQCSAVIEAKASRSDFLADARKPHRIAGGLGTYRFYLCPPDVIQVSDLPERWGLLYADGRTIREILRPTGNAWPSPRSPFGDWSAFQHEADQDAERGVLFSIARRRSLSRSDEQYERKLQDETRRADRLARENVDLAEKVRRLELALYLAERGLKADKLSTIERKAAIRRKVA